jgi:RNA polymerase sigma-70 factor (ECF subfamily)
MLAHDSQLQRPMPSGRPVSTFAEVYEGNVNFAWRVLRRFGVPEALLHDAAQDVFIVVHRRLGSFEGRSTVKTWIFGIARRVARDYREGGRAADLAAVRLEALPDTSCLAREADARKIDAARLLEQLLSKLDTPKREAFILIDVEQMTIAEAAESLGASSSTVYSRLKAARTELERAAQRLEVSTGETSP